MLLIIDNYDSFTYNLAQYFSELKMVVRVIRNDKLTQKDIEIMKPGGIVISPGPGDPDGAGISKKVVMDNAGIIPILGVCLGHQTIGRVFGGTVDRAKTLMHGKTSLINHDGKGVFKGIPTPFSAVRYHSLVVTRESIPDCLEITAWTEDGEIMGLRHKEYSIEGVQFHPESFLTEYGHKMLNNFLMENGLTENYQEVI
ncbi:MAG: aminodeoxychorismate/anthranilate synthase component II [Peptococcaceae bacterium]|nr:aminodeoxychorismate/anthranilate synthase component II [Peptococcaceae bacterium]